MNRRSLILLMGILLVSRAARSVLAEDSAFEAVAAPQNAQVGDLIHVTLGSLDEQFDPDDIVGVAFDLDEEKWHLAQSWEALPPSNPPDRSRLWEATLQCFESGEVELPPVQVIYRLDDGSTTQTQARRKGVRIESVLAESEEPPPLRDLHPLYGFPRDWRPIVIAVLGALAALAVAGYFIRRWMKRRRGVQPEEPVEPELPPGVWALQEIERLSRLPVNREGPAKAIAVLASEVVRVYTGRRWNFSALDMTTYECLRELRSRRLNGEQYDLMRRYLDFCDLAKFSKFEPMREEWARYWDDAREIVERTTPPSERDAGDEAGARPEFEEVAAP